MYALKTIKYEYLAKKRTNCIISHFYLLLKIIITILIL